MKNRVLLLLILFVQCFAGFGQTVSKSPLFFSPEKTDRMWDTWMYYDNNTFYLYYLITKNTPGEGIGLATSKDGVNWEEKGLILSKSPEAKWIGTGSIWRSISNKVQGKYILNFSEWYGPELLKGQQYIFFATSDNLIDWKRLDEKFIPDSALYKIDKNLDSRWDCIYTIAKPEGGGRYGYWTGNPKAFHPGFGFGQTSDGVHWDALPAPVIEWGNTPKLPVIEAGAIEKINGKYYMMIGSLDRYDGRVGMYTIESDSPKGPFRPAVKNFKLLTSPPEQLYTYFARFFPFNGETLINHHAIDKEERYFGLLKKAAVDKEGILRMGYWLGNEKLKGKKIELQVPAVNPNASLAFLSETFNVNRGIVLEGSFPLLKGDERSALYLQTANNNGIAIVLNADGGVQIGSLTKSIGDFKPNDEINRETKFSSQPHFKLFLKKSLIEFYIDDILIQCYTLPAKATGKIGIVSSLKAIHDFKAWNIK